MNPSEAISLLNVHFPRYFENLIEYVYLEYLKSESVYIVYRLETCLIKPVARVKRPISQNTT